jgi:hypothetical protein
MGYWQSCSYVCGAERKRGEKGDHFGVPGAVLGKPRKKTGLLSSSVQDAIPKCHRLCGFPEPQSSLGISVGKKLANKQN